ncbi:MAG: ribosome silencing factor [Rubricella sp.]
MLAFDGRVNRHDEKEEFVLSDLQIASGPEGAHRAGQPAAEDGPSADALLELVLKSLDDDKAEDVLSLALRGKSEIADHMVIASGRSTRQVSAIAEHLLDRVKEATGTRPRVEGIEAGDWVLIDAGDVLVHVFRPEVREFYQLEKMWMTPEEALARRQAQ